MLCLAHAAHLGFRVHAIISHGHSCNRSSTHVLVLCSRSHTRAACPTHTFLSAVQAKTPIAIGMQMHMAAPRLREPPIWLAQHPGQFDATGTEHAATAPVEWADEAELAMRRAAAPAAVLDAAQQPHVKLAHAEVAGAGAERGAGADGDAARAQGGGARGAAAGMSENVPGEGNKQAAPEQLQQEVADDGVQVPAKRPLQQVGSAAALASPTAKALYGEELDSEPTVNPTSGFQQPAPFAVPHAFAAGHHAPPLGYAGGHVPQQAYGTSGQLPGWVQPQPQQQLSHAHTPYHAQPPYATAQVHLALPPAHTFEQPQSDPEYQPPLPEEPYEPDAEDAPPLPPGDPDESDAHNVPAAMHAPTQADAAEEPPPLPSDDDEGDAAADSRLEPIPPPAPPAAASARSSVQQSQPGFNHDAQHLALPPGAASANALPRRQPLAPDSAHMTRVPSSAHVQPRAASVDASPAYPGLSAAQGQSPAMSDRGSVPYQVQAGGPTPAQAPGPAHPVPPATHTPPVMRPPSMPGASAAPAMSGADAGPPCLPQGSSANGMVPHHLGTPGMPGAAPLHQHMMGRQPAQQHMYFQGQQPGLQYHTGPHPSGLGGNAYGHTIQASHAMLPGGMLRAAPMAGPPAGPPPQLPQHVLPRHSAHQPQQGLQPGNFAYSPHSQHVPPQSQIGFGGGMQHGDAHMQPGAAAPGAGTPGPGMASHQHDPARAAQAPMAATMQVRSGAQPQQSGVQGGPGTSVG